MTINENAPKPKPPVKKIAAKKSAPKQVRKPAPKQEKKAYIRPEHLTERPFKENEALAKLAESMNRSMTDLGANK